MTGAIWTTGREERMIELAKPALSPSRTRVALVVGLLELGLVAGLPSPARAGDVTLAETGSTLIDPLFKVWAADYTKTHSGVTISPAATNSVAGVEQAISGAVQIGVSDAYMSDAEVEQNPLIINVPMAISAQTVNYNIPGLNQQNSQAQRPRPCWDIHREDSRVGRPCDRRAQSGGQSPAQRRRSDPPQRPLGRHLRFHPISDVFH